MTDTSFTMAPMKPGRMKYLLLTMMCPLLLSGVLCLLKNRGLIPAGNAAGMISMLLFAVGLGVPAYFLIFQKNHRMEVKESAIIHTDFRGNISTIQANQIRSFRQNILNELLLLDENGKVQLCVESNMNNLDLFRQWLQANHIMNQTKER